LAAFVGGDVDDEDDFEEKEGDEEARGNKSMSSRATPARALALAKYKT